MGCHGLYHISNSQYPGFYQDILPRKPVGIAGAIHLFVVLNHNPCYRPRKLDILQDIKTRLGMRLNQAEFNVG